jgi:hypothetical protein
MLSRRQTAWRKNRKFGDVYGGRTSPKITDRIFNRAHSLQPPAPGDDTLIVFEDNPSRDYFFPLESHECLEALAALPEADVRGLTHLWLRRLRNLESAASVPLAEFICGSGVRVIILYPWRRDMRLCVGRTRPSVKNVRLYGSFGADLIHQSGLWHFQFDAVNLRRFYIEHLLYHEVGHHIDRYQRHWSKSNVSQVEEFADQYAIQCKPAATRVFVRLEEQRVARHD